MKSVKFSVGFFSSLLLSVCVGSEVKAHGSMEGVIHYHTFEASETVPAYDQAPFYQVPQSVNLPSQNFGSDLPWTSFPAGDANQFQIVTIPENNNVTKPVIGQNGQVNQTVTERNLLSTNEDGFLNDVLNNNFPQDDTRVPINNTISTENHPITPYTYSPATAPSQTGPLPHVHWFDAEWFYVTEGELDVWFGDPGAYAPGEIPGVNAPLEDTYHYVHLTEGQMVYTPAGTLHSFHNSSPERASMTTIWSREPNPADPTVPVPEGGIEQFFTHPQIGVQLESPDASEEFVSGLTTDQTNQRIANWNALFSEYFVTISSSFEEYLAGDGDGTTNNPDDPNPNSSVVFDYDPSLLGSNAEFLDSLWLNTPELVAGEVVPEPSSSLAFVILGLGGTFFKVRKNFKFRQQKTT